MSDTKDDADLTAEEWAEILERYDNNVVELPKRKRKPTTAQETSDLWHHHWKMPLVRILAAQCEREPTKGE